MRGVVLAVSVVAGCYSPPRPACGFACGPGGACPAGYTCADGICGTGDLPVGVSCGTPAMPDAAINGPHVLQVVPFAGETDVGVDVIPVVYVDTFLENVTHHTVYMIAGASLVAGNPNYLAQSTQLSWIPASQLSADTTYTVKITGAVTDEIGDPLGPYHWSFTTGADRTAPQVKYVTPFPNQLGVPSTTSISVQFDEVAVGVDASTFTVSVGGVPVAGAVTTTDEQRYLFTPSAVLPPASVIDVALSTAIHDAAGNFISPYSFSFMTL
jgi:hypothetical protein